MEEVTIDDEDGILRIKLVRQEGKSILRVNTKKTMADVEDDFPPYTKK